MKTAIDDRAHWWCEKWESRSLQMGWLWFLPTPMRSRRGIIYVCIKSSIIKELYETDPINVKSDSNIGCLEVIANFGFIGDYG